MATEPAGGPRFYGRETASAAAPPAAPPGHNFSWTPPPPTRKRRGLPVLLVIVLVASIAGGAFWASRRHPGPSYPKQWDPRVADLVSFVEHERGLHFEHPVKVEFVPVAKFKHDLTTSSDSLTKKDREEITNTVAFLRALGLVEGNVDLLAKLNQTTSEGVLAYYDPDTKRISVKGTNLDVATRVTLVHEMTHALQDQHFDLTKLQKLDHDDDSGAITALVEGDATTVENAYVDSLSTSERRAYDKENGRQQDGADFKGVPPVIRIMFGAPYDFGPALVAVLRADGGQHALDVAFVHPPTAQEHFFDPPSYLRHDEPEHVAKPSVPAGAKANDSGAFEPLGWFITLSERIDAHEALHASDGWGGDAYVAYRTRQGDACTRVRYRGEHTSDTAEMRRALGDWIDALPARTATVTDEGSTLLFQSCDPGSRAHVATGRSMDAIALPISRAQILQEMLHDGAPLDASECVANNVVAQYSVAELNDPSGRAFTSPEGQQRLLQIAAACRAKLG